MLQRVSLFALLTSLLLCAAATQTQAGVLASYNASLGGGVADDPVNQGWSLSDIAHTINGTPGTPLPGAILASNAGPPLSWEMNDVAGVNTSGPQFYYREIGNQSGVNWTMAMNASIRSTSGAAPGTQISLQTNLFHYQVDAGLDGTGKQRYNVWRTELAEVNNGNGTFDLVALGRQVIGGGPATNRGPSAVLLDNVSQSAAEAFYSYEMRYDSSSGKASLFFDNGGGLLPVVLNFSANLGGVPEDIDRVQTEIIGGVQTQVPQPNEPINVVAFGSFASNEGGHMLIGSVSFATVPEPSSVVLIGLGTLGLALLQKRRRYVG